MNKHIASLSGGLLAAAFTSVVSAQNVGIGTTSPKSKLSVNGTTASGGMAIGDATYTSTTGTVAPVNGAIIQGNVGVGTPAPQHLMHIVDGNFFRENSNGNASTFITTDGGIRVFRNGPALVAPTVNGYVDVRNDSAGGTNYGRMYYYKGVAGQPAPYNAGEGLGFGAGTDTVAQMLIESNTGQIGMGTYVPQAKLHVNGQTWIADDGITGDIYLGTANKNGVQMHPNAWIGIQREGDAANLHLSKPTGTSTGARFAQFIVNGTVLGHITRNGAGVLYNTTSDERLKENIRPSAKGLADVMKMQVSDYNYKSDPGREETGFIAQQLNTVFPDAVSKGGEDPAEKPWTVDYGRVTPLLVKAVQEQQQVIEGLRKENSLQAAALAESARQNADLREEMQRLAAAMETIEALVHAQAPEKGERQTVSTK